LDEGDFWWCPKFPLVGWLIDGLLGAGMIITSDDWDHSHLVIYGDRWRGLWFRIPGSDWLEVATCSYRRPMDTGGLGISRISPENIALYYMALTGWYFDNMNI
jgi:hypothetical protein